MLESLFTRIHGLKLRSFVLKILKIVCDLKQNLLLDNTFKTCQNLISLDVQYGVLEDLNYPSSCTHAHVWSAYAH